MVRDVIGDVFGVGAGAAGTGRGGRVIGWVLIDLYQCLYITINLNKERNVHE